MDALSAIVFTLGINSQALHSPYGIDCQQGDYWTSIYVAEGKATVKTCNQDWSCYQSTTATYVFSEKNSDDTTARFVDQNSLVKLEVASQAKQDNSIDVILDGRRDFICYLNR